MKKNIRRWLALCLALVLVFSMAVVASAATTASESFTNVTGAYTITMTKGASNDRVEVIPGAVGFGHTSGFMTVLADRRSYSYTQSVSLMSPYEVPLGTLLGRLGLQRGCVAAGDTGPNFLTVNANQPTGTYKLGVVIKCYNTQWTLLLDEPYTGNADPGRTESMSKVPTGEWYVTPVRVS